MFVLRFLATLIFVTLITSPLFAETSGWKLRTEKDGVIVYTRQVSGSSLLEFKGETVINAPIEDVIAFFNDNSEVPKWYYQCMKKDLLKDEGANSKLFYFEIDLPSPFATRDAVFRQVESRDPVTGVMTYHMYGVADRGFPVQRKKVRVPFTKTVWTFTPLTSGKTHVIFQQHSDPGGALPKFLVNALVVDIPLQSLRMFRERIEERQPR